MLVTVTETSFQTLAKSLMAPWTATTTAFQIHVNSLITIAMATVFQMTAKQTVTTMA